MDTLIITGTSAGPELELPKATVLSTADLQAEFRAIEAESIGWIPLGEAVYLHVGDSDDQVITVVGVPDASMAGMNVLLLGW